MAVPAIAPGSQRAQGVFFLVAGIGLLVLAVIVGLHTRDFVREASRAEGRVVALNAGGSHPQIEFTTATGSTHSYPQGGLISGYEVGDVVHVLYRPENPSLGANLDTWGATWDWVLLLLCLGVVFAVAGGWQLSGRSSR